MGAEQSGHEGVVPSSGSDNDGALLDPYVLNASLLVTAVSSASVCRAAPLPAGVRVLTT